VKVEWFVDTASEFGNEAVILRADTAHHVATNDSSTKATALGRVAGSSEASMEPTVVAFGELPGDASFESLFNGIKAGPSQTTVRGP
jgi:hypothetical protein